MGDKVLADISNLITNSKRPYDLLYRIGGEEFMIILPNTNLEEAKLLSEHIRITVESHQFDPVNLTISLGVCEYKDGDTDETLYKRVDDALYRAKESGRNKVETCL